MTDTFKPNAHQCREIAVKAECDPKTVAAAFAGSNIRPTVATRIVRALRELGRPIPAHIAAAGGAS